MKKDMIMIFSYLRLDRETHPISSQALRWGSLDPEEHPTYFQKYTHTLRANPLLTCEHIFFHTVLTKGVKTDTYKKVSG